MKKKLLVILSVLFVISTLFSGCQNRRIEEGNTAIDTIKIGVFEPLSGANAAGGKLELEGVKLAHKLYPRVLGKRVDLVIVDNKSDVVEAENAATKLVDQKKVEAIIGSWGSSFSMAAGDAVKIAKVPTVGASCTNPLVTQGNDYYFRVCFLDPFQGQVMANYAYYKLHAKKVAVIKEVTNDYAVGLARFFSDAFIQYTNNENCIVSDLNYNTNDRDFSVQLRAIKSHKLDAIFATGNFTETAFLIKQARDLGIKVPFIGGDTWETPEFISIGDGAVEGAAFSTFFSEEKPATSEAKTFLEAYKEEYGKNSVPSADTALAYDAYLVIIDAIKRAGEANSVKIRDALAATKNFPGAAGVINFDENRDAEKNAIIKIVKNGKLTYLYTYDINEKNEADRLKK